MDAIAYWNRYNYINDKVYVHMNLVRLTPSQASAKWDALYTYIAMSLPTASEINKAKLLSSVMSGQFQVWVAFDDVDEVAAVVTTTFMQDTVDGDKSLVIYSLTAVKQIEDGFYTDGLETLRKFAKAAGSDRVVGYTDNVRLLKVAELLGANTSIRMISLEV